MPALGTAPGARSTGDGLDATASEGDGLTDGGSGAATNGGSEAISSAANRSAAGCPPGPSAITVTTAPTANTTATSWANSAKRR